MAPAFRGDPMRSTAADTNPQRSAVLIAIFPLNGIASTLLIKRAVYNGVHSGQIGFPGGKVEDTDPSISATALREAEEEVGINPESVEILGLLTSLYIPVSNMLVQPVIGLLKAYPELHLNLQEVEYTINAPLSHLKDTENQSIKTINMHGNPVSAPYFRVGNEQVWGATAMIISELIELYD
jgi:8-oxo-dGTP pyrophosphatase MutT (NUDIX family)